MISSNVVCATSKGSDQPALISAFASLEYFMNIATGRTSFGIAKLKRRLHRLV